MRGRKYCTVRVLYIHMSILSWITGSWSEHICITGQMTGSGCTLYCIKTRIQYPRKITTLPHSFISYYFFREIFFLFLQRHYFCIIFFHNPVFAVLLPSYLFCVTSWYILLILCCYFFFFRDASFLSCDDWLVLTLYFEPVCWYWGPP